MATTAMIPVPETALDVTVSTTLPSIESIRHRMQWMGQFRKLLKEYVEQQMDPARHMYSFANNSYTLLRDRKAIAAMLEQGQKPALNQDGIHNLMALYEADIDDEHHEVLREDGHYTVKVKIWLRYFGGRRIVGYGTCSTRESKYAYRWVSSNQVPKDMDKGALKSRTYEGRSGAYTRYRLDNDDLGDLENTIDQMALKRAKSSAVKALPGVSEMFAVIGDPEEEPVHDTDDTERQEVLRTLKTWLSTLRASVQVRALEAIFGEPMKANDVPKQDLETLLVAALRVQRATAAQINWQSPTLAEDLKRAMAASAAKATADLFGDQAGKNPTAPVEEIDPETGEIIPNGVGQATLWEQEEAREKATNPGVQGGS